MISALLKRTNDVLAAEEELYDARHGDEVSIASIMGGHLREPSESKPSAYLKRPTADRRLNMVIRGAECLE